MSKVQQNTHKLLYTKILYNIYTISGFEFIVNILLIWKD